MDRACKGVNTAGQTCSAKPVRADGYCYWHSPGLEAERAEGRRKGGASRSNKARAAKALGPEPMTLRELHVLLGVTVRGTLTGRVEPSVANAVASLSRAMTAVVQAGEVEERLRELEAVAGLADRRRA